MPVMRTRVIGLTGGIASGKSTVGRMFVSLGATLFDADTIARDLVQPGEPALVEIVRMFGPSILTPDGCLDRKALASRIFADKEAKKKLEDILHPRIRKRCEQLLSIENSRGTEVVLYEASLLVETGEYRSLDGLIVVTAPLEIQLRRLMERDSLSEEEAHLRISAQAPVAAKIAVADYVIDGSASLEETHMQVTEVWKDIQGGGPKRRRWEN